MTDTTPSPEALEAAKKLLRPLPMSADLRCIEYACALDEFARQAVERERDRCADIINQGHSRDTVLRRVVTGDAP